MLCARSKRILVSEPVDELVGTRTSVTLVLWARTKLSPDDGPIGVPLAAGPDLEQGDLEGDLEMGLEVRGGGAGGIPSADAAPAGAGLITTDDGVGGVSLPEPFFSDELGESLLTLPARSGARSGHHTPPSADLGVFFRLLLRLGEPADVPIVAMLMDLCCALEESKHPGDGGSARASRDTTVGADEAR